MFQIAFIDELPEDIRRFELYVHKNRTLLSEGITVIPFIPPPTLEEFIQTLLESDIDAIITDFQLNEYKPDVTYSGVELVESFLNHREDFPCFILTSFDDDAVKESEDVNIIYVKGIMGDGEENAKITFLERVEEQIKHYRKRLEKAEAEILALIQKSENQPLDLKERERLIELDNFLEATASRKYKIPDNAKVEDFLGDLKKLVANTAELLNKLNNPKNE